MRKESLVAVMLILKDIYNDIVTNITRIKIKPKKHILKGVEYSSKDEVLDTYGVGLITASQRDKLLASFELSKKDEEIIEMLTEQASILVNFINDLRAAIMKIEER